MSTADGSETYGYDESGNLTERQLFTKTETLSWNALGKVDAIAGPGGTTRMIYDADGNRVARIDDSGDATVFAAHTEMTYTAATDSVSAVRSYLHSGDVIATRSSIDGVLWLGSDHHGTAVWAIAAATMAVTVRRKDPYGNPRGGAVDWGAGQKGFVGGIEDPTGLVHIGARSYDPSLGRFISADPIRDFADPQQINGYTYANANPVTMSDPTGLMRYDPVTGEGVGVPTKPGSQGPVGGGWQGPAGGYQCVPGVAVASCADFGTGWPTPSSEFESVVDYIFTEMARNATSDFAQVASMHLYEMCFETFMSYCIDKGKYTNAYGMWAQKVCSECDWDHKPKLRDLFGMDLADNDSLYIDIPGTNYRIRYDIWSNIHYGYVGTEIGFDAGDLIMGANAGDSVTGINEAPDDVAVQIGIDLRKNYSADELTSQMVYDAVIAAIPDIIAAQTGQKASLPGDGQAAMIEYRI